MGQKLDPFGGSLLAVLIAAFSPPVVASTVLTFEVASHTETPKGATQVKGEAKPADANYALTVALGGDTMQIVEPDKQRRYDFKSGRIYQLDTLKKTYADISLYTVIGFDVEEFPNRMMLGKMLAAGKIKANPMAPALTENLMSLSDPANATVIDRSTKGDETTYSWSGQTLATVSQHAREAPAPVMRQYLRFLRYETGGHPQILAAIERGHGIPERLTVVRTNMGIETRTLTLQSIEERPDPVFSLDGYSRDIPSGEPFVTLKRLSASPAADLEAHAGVLRQERDAAATGGHIFDAMLTNLALMLSTGDEAEAGAWFAAHHDEISANTDAQSLMKSLNPHDAASANVAADTLAKLRQTAGPHGYVVNIFEANTRLSLQQGAKAQELFLAALTADPTITGAWIDLGTAYYRDYEVGAAWACWDAARDLRPTHHMLKAVDDREQKLRSDHPEFF